MNNIELFESVAENLQYFTGSIVITQATGKLASVGIGTGWTVGDYFQVTGTSNSNIVGLITYIHSDDSYILATAVSENGVTVAWGTGETAGSGKMNQIFYTEWQDLAGFWEVSGSVYASGACDVYIQQSWAGTYVDFSGTKVDVSAATPTIIDEDAKCRFGRMKLLAEDADLTYMRAYFGGKMS
jgi:hypothetical protein